MIEIRDLTKVYGRTQTPAVKGLNLEISDGEILGFAGLNGAGKSTTIRLVSGIIFPTAGHVTIDHKDIVKDKIEASKNIGWVPELPNFEPNAKSIPLLKYYAGFYGMKGHELEERIEVLLKRFNIWEARNKKLKEYSQGMKKRFSIAAAMIGEPQNFLFDETLNGLDPEGVRNMREVMLQLKKDGKAVFLSSHILSELENVADRIAIIKKGELIRVVERSELSSLGSTAIRIRIDNMDKGAMAILEKYGKVETVDHTLIVKDLKIDSAEANKINKELAKSEYDVSFFEISGEDLEDYFIELVGEKK
ncbi:MAG: ABC transporter ATP-binding protein [Candidatus Thermoplasmatota archaeon]|nr:ABC transporter ATP-binding protein [Candidatus Thermoplasmatota archaeon]